MKLFLVTFLLLAGVGNNNNLLVSAKGKKDTEETTETTTSTSDCSDPTPVAIETNTDYGTICCDAATNPSLCLIDDNGNVPCGSLVDITELGVEQEDSFKIDCEASGDICPSGYYDFIQGEQNDAPTSIEGDADQSGLTVKFDDKGDGIVTQSLTPGDGIAAVIVKASNAAYIYFGDEMNRKDGLETPVNSKNGKNYALSHIEWVSQRYYMCLIQYKS